MVDDDIIILTTAVVVLERVSRQAKELLVGTLLILLMMMILTVVEVEVNIMSISFSFVKIRIFDADLGRQIRILTPSRVELIGKGSIFALKTITNR